MRAYQGMILCLALLALAACAPQAAQTPAGGPFALPEGADPDAAVITVVKERIVVSMVELSEGAYISTVTFFVPPEWMNAQVYVNGEKDALLVLSDPAAGTLKVSLFAMQPTARAEITFLSGETLLATCTVEVADSVTLAGDCGW